VPQRKDVDGFFGSVVEPEFIQIMQDRGRNPFEIWLDPKLSRKHRPKLTYAGETWEHYFTKSSAKPVQGHTSLIVTNNEHKPICNLNLNLNLKVSPDRVLAAKDGEVELVVERDYRPAVIASVLKAAHLTMFHIMGYVHVLSAGGIYVADILKQFYLLHGGKHGVSEANVERYFLKYETMMAPLFVENDAWFRGTIEDNLFLTLLTSHNEVFALGVIVRAGPDRFCVCLPTDCGKTINTYVSFLNEPPPSVRAKATRFRAPKDGDLGAWEADVNDIRIPMRHPMPDREKVMATLIAAVQS
jgi:hypothetical protein